MPCGYAGNESRSQKRKDAIAYVKIKFPSLIVGSSGWYRAVEGRMRK